MGWRVEDSLIKGMSPAWDIKELRDWNWALGCTDLRRKTENRNPFVRKYTMMGGPGVLLL